MEIHKLKALAQRGSRDAHMLLSMVQAQARQQDESDRKWRNMAAYINRLKAEGKDPDTGGAFLEAFRHCGYEPNFPLSLAQQNRHMDLPAFMQACAGFRDINAYPLMCEPDAPAKCELCKQLGASMRCSHCGEWYCSAQCFQRDRRDHLPTCQAAAESIYCAGPPQGRPELWTTQKYATAFGLPERKMAPVLKMAAASSSSASHDGVPAVHSSSCQQEVQPPAAVQQKHPQGGFELAPQKLTKGQKKNAKKRAKRQSAKMGADAAAHGDRDQEDQQQQEDADLAAAAAEQLNVA